MALIEGGQLVEERADGRHRDLYVVGDLIEDSRARQLATENVIDAYRDRNLGVHVRVRIRGVEGEAHDHVAVFQALMRDDLQVGWDDELTVDDDVVVAFGGDDGRWMQDAVSVLPRKLMEQPESWIPSVVRLYRFDRVPVLLGQLLYPVLALEQLGISEDGELDGIWGEVALQGWVLSQRAQRDRPYTRRRQRHDSRSQPR